MGNLIERCRIDRFRGTAISDFDVEEYGIDLIGRRKRKRTTSLADDAVAAARCASEEAMLSTPKSKKIKSTSEYIYDTLYLNGKHSDITIVALDHEFKLHKLYLAQSAYFDKMFGGDWKEKNMQTIVLEIPDPRIDVNALKIAFGSLYTDEVMICPTEVVSVLAASSLLVLDALEKNCVSVMNETVSISSVCPYIEAAEFYSQAPVRRTCFEWLQRNLMTAQSVELLRQISPLVMQEVVANPRMFVIQVEMDIYSLLKKWVYLHLFPVFSGNYKDLGVDSEGYWKVRGEACRREFILTPDGRPFKRVFRVLRFHHIMNDLNSIRLIEEEKIVPFGWIVPYYRQQWLHMLRLEQDVDSGPDEDVDEETFDKWCMRCGRLLTKEGSYCWRWTGYSYGIDLLISYSSRRVLVFKRNTFTQPCTGAVSLRANRNVHYRITVCSQDHVGHIKNIKTTPILKFRYSKDEEKVVLSLDRDLEFPILISAQVLLFTPDEAIANKACFLQVHTDNLGAGSDDSSEDGSEVESLVTSQDTSVYQTATSSRTSVTRRNPTSSRSTVTPRNHTIAENIANEEANNLISSDNSAGGGTSINRSSRESNRGRSPAHVNTPMCSSGLQSRASGQGPSSSSQDASENPDQNINILPVPNDVQVQQEPHEAQRDDDTDSDDDVLMNDLFGGEHYANFGHAL